MEIKGSVDDIIFVNEENGYTVLNFVTDDDYFTAVGIFPLVSPGESLILTGEFKKNSKFGEQFSVTEVKFAQPDDSESVLKYLASGLFKGIGEKLAVQIVNYFGPKTMDILENHPEELKKVSGIGKKKLAEIVESYKETKNMKDTIFFLQKYDVTMGLALKIYRIYGESTISVVQNNPYILVESIEGVGFLTADRIAEKMGIDRHSPFRIKAGIIHVLTEAGGKGGHTCLPRNILIDSAVKLMNVEASETEEALDGMFVKKIEVDGTEIIATELNYYSEYAIATKLLILKDGADRWDLDAEQELKNYEKSSLITFHPQQREAIKSIFDSGVTVITGGPGTGKTTIIKAIATIAEQRNKKVIMCAPTGRASKRMTEMTGVESKTIHRLLGFGYGNDSSFEWNENNPLTADVIIVDEISMADIFIFNSLLKAIPRGARLVLVGDKDQLPSVSCGNILSDVISSGIINTIFLTEIYRQESTSLIVTNAHRINKGLMPLTDNKSDFFITYKTDGLDILNTVISMIKTRIPKYANVTSNDIQVLTPVRKGITGVENMNSNLQSALNPDGAEYVYHNTVFRVGDKVMQIINNYATEWKKIDTGEMGSGVYNGDIGFVSAVRESGIDVLFDDGKLVVYNDGDLDELTLAYCVSVHKSQGSEFPVVILALTGANYMIMTRNLLYTAVTRAKKMVVIVGEEACIKRMVSNNYTAKRYSLLKEFLLRNQEKVASFWSVSDK